MTKNQFQVCLKNYKDYGVRLSSLLSHPGGVKKNRKLIIKRAKKLKDDFSSLLSFLERNEKSSDELQLKKVLLLFRSTLNHRLNAINIVIKALQNVGGIVDVEQFKIENKRAEYLDNLIAEILVGN